MILKQKDMLVYVTRSLHVIIFKNGILVPTNAPDPGRRQHVLNESSNDSPCIFCGHYRGSHKSRHSTFPWSCSFSKKRLAPPDNVNNNAGYSLNYFFSNE